MRKSNDSLVHLRVVGLPFPLKLEARNGCVTVPLSNETFKYLSTVLIYHIIKIGEILTFHIKKIYFSGVDRVC